MSNYKRAQKDTTLIYKQLIEKQKEFIRKNTNQKDCNTKKKIVVSPAFLTFAKEYEKNSLELDERIANHTRKGSMGSCKNVSISLRDSLSPKTSYDKYPIQSPRIKRSPHKETMLLALHHSECQLSKLQSPSILQNIKHELSTDKLEMSMKTKKLAPIMPSPKRFRYIDCKFGKNSDTSWMYKHKNLEDLLRNDCENRVKQVIDEALKEFEIDPTRYA